uniref:Zinc-binding protein A33-like n=1 Tax=Labrus bergylta TaxID=56723 RepID=A0A3Q3E333_9LABR
MKRRYLTHLLTAISLICLFLLRNVSLSTGCPRQIQTSQRATADTHTHTHTPSGQLTILLYLFPLTGGASLLASLLPYPSCILLFFPAPAALLVSPFPSLLELGAKIELMIQERETKIEEIKLSAELSGKSADRQITDSEQAFAVLLQTLKESLDNLIESINEKRKTTQKQAEECIQELEQELSELRKRSAELEKMLRKQKDQFAKDVSLDPNTAHPNLVLSDNGKQVYCGDVKQSPPDCSKRFLSAINVLGKQSFSSGRFYYEVQVKGKTSWDLGVVKESIDRKGSINASPENGYWTICLRKGENYRSSGIHLRVKSQLEKVGVFVDYGEGSVSFYDVDSAHIIHTFTGCSFTEKLYPFFSPGLYLSGKNSAPLSESELGFAPPASPDSRDQLILQEQGNKQIQQVAGPDSNGPPATKTLTNGHTRTFNHSLHRGNLLLH